MKANKILGYLAKSFPAMILASLATFLVITRLFPTAQVHGASMEPTLHEGDYLILDHGEISRGDIVVLRDPTRDRCLVKRVAGLGGDTIDVTEDGTLSVNGEEVPESYASTDGRAWSGTYPVTIPEGKCFLLGDNRDASMDSRTIGPVDLKNIIGRALFRLWPDACLLR